MAIKRLTIELDDSIDTAKSTAPPASLIPIKKALPEKMQNTGTPMEQDDYNKQETPFKELYSGKSSIETIGRTPSDLVFAFISRPEFIATGLIFLSFLIFVKRLQTLSDFWLPGTTSVIFNAVWFGIVTFRRIADRHKKNEKDNT